MDLRKKIILPKPGTALAGRSQPALTEALHAVNGRDLFMAEPQNAETIYVGMGCFWGVEKLFWQQAGVYLTAVGYAGGETQNPTYEEVCTGQTGHTEVVKIVFSPEKISRQQILKLFWENHVPTLGMRQGNDVGSQYRSAIYCTTAAQLADAEVSFARYQQALWQAGFGGITTEIGCFSAFFYAEAYHQQYLQKHPDGYCHHLTIKETGLPKFE